MISQELEPWVSHPPKPSDFLFHIHLPSAELIITPVSYWHVKGAQYDGELKDDLQIIAPSCADIFLEEISESSFSISDLEDIASIEQRLSQAGFIRETPFSHMIDSLGIS